MSYDELKRKHEEQRARVGKALGTTTAFTLLAPQVTREDMEYGLRLNLLGRFVGQTPETIDAYIRRYQAQWIARPEPAPNRMKVLDDLLLRVASCESIDWEAQP